MSQAGVLNVTAAYPSIPTQFDADSGSAIPIANVLNILGTSVASGTTPVETTASGGTVTVEVQTSQAIAGTDASKIGLAAFNSAQFTVDVNGFVTFAGGGAATNIGVDVNTAPGTDPVVPSGGTITFTGAQVATGIVGANVIRTDSVAANTVTIEIQRSTAVAATDSTKNGVSHFNSTQFSVDANGFVALLGGGIGWSVIVADQSAVAGNGYICNKAGLLTLTLPASGAIGDIIQVTGINTALGWRIAQNANQQIFLGTTSTTVGVAGSLSSINIRDSVEMVCVVAGASTVWNVISSVGNLTII